MKNTPKLVSLFSGCGGMDVGFERAGFKRVWANDFDKFAPLVALAIIVIVCVVITFAVCIARIRIWKKVQAKSKKLDELLRLNEENNFSKIESCFSIKIQYPYKNQFLNAKPEAELRKQIRDNIEYFSKYFEEVDRNRNLYSAYKEKINKIIEQEESIDYKQVGVKEKVYKKIERKLIMKNILKPVIDCSFLVYMSYTSPKGKVFCEKYSSFDYDQVKRSFGIYKQKKSFITDCERRYLSVIKGIVGDRYIVQPQINLASVIEKNMLVEKYQGELFRNVDFGIFDLDYNLMALVEINDVSHQQQERAHRDIMVSEICKRARIPLMIFETKDGIDKKLIAIRLSQYLDLKETEKADKEQ